MSELILLTGASGFLGSHIALELLRNGYRVRALARGPKVDELKALYAKYGDSVEVKGVTDITTAEFPEAFDGVDAVIHSAAALPQKEDADVMVRSAVDGTMNVARQTEQAGIKRLVVTSSIATVINPSLPPPEMYTDQDWYPVADRQQALASSKMDAYRAAKTIAEKELWAFGEAHPHLDITTLNPPYLYGPFSPTFPLPPPGSYHALSTPLQLYRLLTPRGRFPPSAAYADVRDVALCHVRALRAAPAPHPPSAARHPPERRGKLGYAAAPSRQPPRKRVLLASPHPFDAAYVRALISVEFPDLEAQGRLTREVPPRYERDVMGVEWGRVEEVLGVGKEACRRTEETVVDTVRSLLEVERRWREEGWEGPGEVI
ncbi:putative 3-beta hydroxysteroid dehydrogenase/isomerase family protein [Lyophyllum shimeji]|uniref:3-beta hydroxysteroid dehydrogenase/isomerase family protein n=1 Tax=Lyophyllum shimeji TaxID=47721 RepID=A0A9P3UQV2_LYOSH|nr:putative 3-beta hydroxysteroid dehydrogenase/isomerase family protein [Lyophyllum shimeji]